MCKLTLKLKKKRGQPPSMTCYREDGSTTGQRSGVFFVQHDIHHFAIETTLGLDRAFYGYVAKGWDIADFGTPWPKGKFPSEDLPQLMLAEMMAARLDLEKAGFELSAEDLNNTMIGYSAEQKTGFAIELTQEHLLRNCRVSVCPSGKSFQPWANSSTFLRIRNRCS